MDISDYSSYQGSYDNGHHDTDPGDKSPLSPPAGWIGLSQDYINLLYVRLSITSFAQRYFSIARHLSGIHYKVHINGQFAKEANTFLTDQFLNG